MNIASATAQPLLPRFSCVEDMLDAGRPNEPVYCVRPDRLHAATQRFLKGFQGRTIYAVKCNPSRTVLDHLITSGIQDFDVASLHEIATVKTRRPDAQCYFMAPVRLVGAAGDAYQRFGVKDFAIDTLEELGVVLAETEATDLTIHVRLAAPTSDALFELSSKFGASPDLGARILRAAADSGCRTGLTFHVGSQCTDDRAFAKAIALCGDVIRAAGVNIGALDIGGGFPVQYCGAEIPNLEDTFASIERAIASAPIGPDCEILCEPGRALVADAISLVTQVILRKGPQIYLNDGAFGSFMERNLEDAGLDYPTNWYRADGSGAIRPMDGSTQRYKVYGPTCDSCDVLSEEMALPAHLQRGDWIEFEMMGAYTFSYTTQFNGFYPGTFIELA
jgi:ornithine decarboxylase